MKRKLIEWLDWVDDHVLAHRFPAVCNAIAHSPWWGEPVNLDDLTPEQAREEVNKPYPNYEVGERYSYAEIRAMQDTNLDL